MSSRLFLIIILVSAIGPNIYSQDKFKDRDKSTLKETAIEDRAAGIHNASNIGLFFENRGKLYPRRITQGPSGEFPINSTKHYIFRINQLVGIPGNVIQARYTNNEEWEAVGGYHNPELAKVAMSDNPLTWHPQKGWPIRNSDGENIFKSDQDSYCVYSDSNNSRSVLNLQLAQTGYTYGVQAAQNIIFFKYDVINAGNVDYDSLYFALYTDIDVGNISGGVPEYGDDFIGFDKENNFIYFYDDGISQEWPDFKTGYMGVTFLQTPEIEGAEAGITDMHYNLYFDDEDQDTIQYGIMSSSESLYNSSIGGRYFHLGENEGLHYDDPATIPSEGLDIVATVSSGPYNLIAGDTLTFITAIIAGESLPESYASLDIAKQIVAFDFDFVRPPDNSNLSGLARDGKAYLYWDDKAEDSYDKFSNEYDFEGYRVYRSIDNGITWTLLDDYDIKNFIGNDVGLKYSFVDSSLVNGFEYWYSVTAYDRGNEVVESLESSKGNTTDAVNLVSLIPYSEALGYEPVSTENVEYTGNGISNYSLIVNPVDDNDLAENQYDVLFGYSARREIGEFETESEIIIKDSSQTLINDYRFEFLDYNKVQIVDLTTGDFLEPTPKSYFSGATYNLNDGLAVRLTQPNEMDIETYPSLGDVISIKYVQSVVRNLADSIVANRHFDIERIQSTPDGIEYYFEEPEIVEDVSRIGGTDNIELDVQISNEDAIIDESYIIKTESTQIDAEDNYYLPTTVETLGGESILETDYYDGDVLAFSGLEVELIVDENSLPSGSNMFSITTQNVYPPNLLDSYRLSIKRGVINSDQIADNLSEIRVVPNPYIVTSLYEPEFGELRREPLRQIQFINLPNECEIFIFSLDADLVKTLYHQDVSGTEIWDLRAEGGREVAAGIYLYVVKTKEGEYKDRFAIIK